MGGGDHLGKITVVALAVLQEIEKHKLWQNAAEMGGYIQDKVESWNHPLIREVRGRGLMLGFVLNVEELEKCPDFADSGQAASLFVVKHLMESRLLTVPAEADVVRWLPALTVTGEEVDIALSKMKEVLDHLYEQIADLAENL